MPGFERNRFIDLTEREAKHFTCSICLNIFNNAVRNDCEHTFCKDCVQQWINGNKKTCPECRKPFTTRKRNSRVRNEPNLVIVSNYTFKPNLLANNMINDLKVKCDFESNGCQELLQFGVLSAHLIQCEHRLCKTCGLNLGSNEHNCVELLKNNANELKKQNSTLQSKFKQLENVNNNNVLKMRELEDNNSVLKKYEIMSHILMTATEQCLPMILKPDYVMFGQMTTSVDAIHLNSDSIELRRVGSYHSPHFHYVNDLSLKFNDIREMWCCLDRTLPLIMIKPTFYESKKINEFINGETVFAFGSNPNEFKGYNFTIGSLFKLKIIY